MADKPTLPKWATGPGTWTEGPYTVASHRQNTNETANEYDVVVYGDSITTGVRQMLKTPWKKLIQPHFKGVRVAWWGVPANDVEDLTWRIISGVEQPRVPPKVIVLWIGTNNLGQGRSPVQPLDFLMEYLRKSLPLTHIVFLNMLPTAKYSVKEANARMRDVCARHRAVFASCGYNLDPKDSRLMPDGLHPSPLGYQVVMQCLGPLVTRLARQATLVR